MPKILLICKLFYVNVIVDRGINYCLKFRNFGIRDFAGLYHGNGRFYAPTEVAIEYGISKTVD